MNKFFYLTVLILLNNTLSLGEEMRLECEGIGQNVSQSSSTISSSSYSSETLNLQTLSKDTFSSKILLNFEDNDNWIEIPSSLMSGINRLSNTFKKTKNNKFDLYDVSFLEDKITGKFKLNFMNKPSFNVDRYSGTVFFDGLGVSFSGDCKKVDIVNKKF